VRDLLKQFIKDIIPFRYSLSTNEHSLKKHVIQTIRIIAIHVMNQVIWSILFTM